MPAGVGQIDRVPRVARRDYTEFVQSMLLAAGVHASEASVITQVLVWNDLVGRPTQGLWRVPYYLERMRHGLVASPCRPRFEERAPTITAIDGHHGFGQFLGHVAMERATAHAERHGAGIVAVRGSNHFGSGAYYTNMAAQRGQLGIALSNAFPKVAPHGGLSAVLGTNPFSFAAPCSDGRAVLVDFATAASAGSVIRKAAQDGEPLEEGVAIDAEGRPVRDPTAAGKAVLLAGGAKGFAMMFFVEILSGVLTGAGVADGVASLHEDFERPSDVGHLFLAIDVGRFLPLPVFHERMRALTDTIKGAKTLPGVSEILIPGETRWRLFDQNVHLGVPVDERTRESVGRLAEGLGVPAPWA